MRGFFLCIMLILGGFTLQAQTYEIGGILGGSNYIGDVGRTNFIAPNNIAFGGIFKWNRSPRHSFRFTLIQSQLSGDDANASDNRRLGRGYSFKNNITEASLGLEYTFWEFSMYSGKPAHAPYLYTGITYFKYDALVLRPQTDLIVKYDDAYDFAIPMVVGYKTTVGTKMVLGLEIGARYTLTDGLDGSNPKKGSPADNPVLKFGNTNSDDWYVFTNMTLTFTFGRRPCYCNF